MLIFNPFNHPLFLPALIALLIALGGGLGLILVLARFNFTKIVQGELGARYFSWLVIAPMFLLSLFAGPLVSAVVVLLCLYRLIGEYSMVARLPVDYRIFLYVQAVFTLFIVTFFPQLFSGTIGFTILLLTLFPILTDQPQLLPTSVTHTMWGYIYLIWTLAHLVLLRSLPYGLNYLLLIGFGVAFADIGAYVIGKAIGRHRIAPRVSPNKAYEGILGNFMGVMIAFILLHFVFPSEVSLPVKTILVILVAIGSSWGDLASSLAKRVAGVKDWGHSLPGHGGLLDRLNSSIVVIPLVYYFLVLIS